jgi:hypothetical protein
MVVSWAYGRHVVPSSSLFIASALRSQSTESSSFQIEPQTGGRTITEQCSKISSKKSLAM